ncbi:pentatricopeptide repeat-containing protein At3g18110, chloroplastic-like [Apium graveolens]|uniref:pentatricopeptide repeat-containing protein At3g18110, chloroplastic-like n=1 Tax=Apium graveolens TaxID=4045 RepID=UPI003D7BACB3
MALTGVLATASMPLSRNLEVCKKYNTVVNCCLNDSALLDTSSVCNDQENSRKFSYSRASPSVRWPNLKITDTQLVKNHFEVDDDDLGIIGSEKSVKNEVLMENDDGFRNVSDEKQEVLGRPSKCKAKKMTKLALKRAKDWRQRVQFLTDRILNLRSEEFVADVLDDRKVQMTPTDFCFVVKWVGQVSWQRALEVYEWLNLRHWFSPNARMLATMLSVLGKANQEALAVEIFTRGEEGVGDTVQVYNAMMGVYARNGRFSKVQELLHLMRERGCEPDLVSFNTLINARLKSGSIEPNMARELLSEVRRSGLQPDIITYNTLISACSRGSNLEEAVEIYNDMLGSRCQPDLWTYNAMLSVYGRCGLSAEAEILFNDLESKGFYPDAVTYNSLLYAFAREGNVEKVKKICEEMVKKGFGEDEMTYNTIIHMYGQQGQHDLALQLYRDMKSVGREPDVVTYTVLIDSLGKANKITEAANVMSEMLNAGVKPTIRTYSALICGYAKAGMRLEAEDIFNCMLRSGIKPDHLAYSVMLDILFRSGETNKATMLYHDMVRDGFTPDVGLYEIMVRILGKENKVEDVQNMIKDMEELCDLNPQVIAYILVKGECYSYGDKMFRLAIRQGYDVNRDNLLPVLSLYCSSGRHLEAKELLEFLKEHAPESQQLVSEAMVVTLCMAHQPEAALDEYRKSMTFRLVDRSLIMYESLIKCCEEMDLLGEASQVLSDMRFVGLEPSTELCRQMALVYCRMGYPETAHHLVDQAEAKGIRINDMSIYAALIEAYGKAKLLQKAESVVGNLRQSASTVDRKVWNALIQAYAASGCYEKARAAFTTMMRDGPSPTVETINGLMQALIVDGRLNELYLLIQELQDMGFKISKSTIVLMLDAYAQAGDIFEVKKIYNGMKAAGYFPTMHLYRVMIILFSKGRRVRDVEAMIAEMGEVGFKPDIIIWNSLLRLYAGIEDYKKIAQVYQQIQEAGLKPDEDTYNTLIVMYCRDRRPEEGLSLMHEMRMLGLDPKLNTYKSLLSAFGKLQMLEQTEELFEMLQSGGYKLDRSFYHIMMKTYRNSGSHSKAENLLFTMKDAGIEPTIATMHLLMISYGSSGHPTEAEEVLKNLKSTGENLSTLPYTSVIDAYLKNEDYSIAVKKLLEMKGDGLEPDYRIWTCFVRAASLCQNTSEALTILSAIRDAGFEIPIKLLTENTESPVLEMDQFLEKIEAIEDNSAFNLVNALEDLLWAFNLRATASWVFQLAIKRNIYNHNVFRVAEKDWGADFRKLSAGAALVGLTLWLDHMQDASLDGFPESPKSVVLITGTAEYNQVSLNSTIKAFLWEMGSPFLPCKTRSGLLIAKAHSLRMWLKDSPFCFDLELKNALSLPEENSMQLIDGCYIRCGLVPAFKEITERLGLVRPKKFSRLALLSDEQRDKAIEADIVGRKEKLEKLSESGPTRNKNNRKHNKRPFINKDAVRF